MEKLLATVFEVRTNEAADRLNGLRAAHYVLAQAEMEARRENKAEAAEFLRVRVDEIRAEITAGEAAYDVMLKEMQEEAARLSPSYPRG